MSTGRLYIPRLGKRVVADDSPWPASPSSLTAVLVWTPLAVVVMLLLLPAVALGAPALQLPYERGASWWVNGPHSGDGATGARNHVDLGPGGEAPATIRAAAAGFATVGTCGGTGKYVTIDHGGGWSTRYWHLGATAAGINGRTVAAGDVVGTTAIVCGNPTRFSHVHFGLYYRGQPHPLDGVSIGGYTVHAGSSQYSGYWTRDRDGATVHTTGSDGNSHCCLPNNQPTSASPVPPPTNPPPDGDNDGVPDAQDSCHSFEGPGSNAGCPLALTHGARSLARGDFNGDGYMDLAVGSPGEDIGSAANAGAVFVNYGGVGGLGRVAKQQLYSGAGLSNAAESGDAVGTAVASGDFNGDHYDDLAVGAPGENSDVVDGGMVLTINGSPNGLDPSSAGGGRQGGFFGQADEAGDFLGAALTSGDYNGDGYDDLAAGVPGENSGVADSGTVLTISGSASGLNPADVGGGRQGTFFGQADEAGDFLGAALTSGDYNGDGYDDLAAGVPGENSAVSNGGAVLTVSGSPIGLDPGTAGGGRQGGFFGQADEAGDFLGAALTSGDYNGDGYDDLAAGVPGENSAVADGGAVLTVSGSPIGLDPGTAGGGRQGGFFGQADEAGDLLGVALASGDLNGDGYDELVAGMPMEDSGVVDSGIVLTLNGSAGGLDPSTAGGGRQGGLFGNTDEAGDYLGASVVAGDFNGDCFDDLAAGSPGEGSGLSDSGLVHLVNGSRGGLSAATQSGGRQGGFFAGVEEAGDYLGGGFFPLMQSGPPATGASDGAAPGIGPAVGAGGQYPPCKITPPPPATGAPGPSAALGPSAAGPAITTGAAPGPSTSPSSSRTLRRTVRLRRGCSRRLLRVSGRGVTVLAAKRLPRGRCRLTLRVRNGATGPRHLLVKRGKRTIRLHRVIKLPSGTRTVRRTIG